MNLRILYPQKTQNTHKKKFKKKIAPLRHLAVENYSNLSKSLQAVEGSHSQRIH